MALTDRQILALAPSSKQLRVSDRDGLSLIVTPTGAKLWALQFRWQGKPTQITLGRYDPSSGEHLGLKDARERAAEARKQIAQGLHPGLERRASKARVAVTQARTVAAVAREWLDAQNFTPRYRANIERLFRNDLEPSLGALPVSELDSAHLLPVLQKIAKSGRPTMAITLRGVVGQFMRYAIAARYTNADPTWALKGQLPKHRTTHIGTLRLDQLPLFRERMTALRSTPEVSLAIRLLSLTAVRTIELRFAKWAELDLDAALWTIPAERMKSRRPHIVPLSRQALEALHELRSLTGSHPSGYILPALHVSGRTRPAQAKNPKRKRVNAVLGEKTINTALCRAGYKPREFSGHGFRGTFSTIAHEANWPHLTIEMQLAHTVQGVSASYNHALYIEPRRRLLQWWADTLDGKAQSAEVIPFPAAATGS